LVESTTGSEKMPYKDKDKDKEWRKTNTRFVGIMFQRNSEQEILDWLEKQPSMQGAVKELILQQIAREQNSRGE